MDKLITNISDNLPLLSTIFVAWLTYVYGPKLLAKIQGKNRKEEIKLEGDSQAEVMYVSNMSVILGEYKEQVSGFRSELENVRREFAAFKEAHNKEVAEYKSNILFLEREIEFRDNKINELNTIIITKDEMIEELKERIR